MGLCVIDWLITILLECKFDKWIEAWHRWWWQCKLSVWEPIVCRWLLIELDFHKYVLKTQYSSLIDDDDDSELANLSVYYIEKSYNLINLAEARCETYTNVTLSWETRSITSIHVFGALAIGRLKQSWQTTNTNKIDA